MTIQATDVVGGLLLAAVALPAMACDLPKLPVIPAADQIGDQAPAVTAATSGYFEGMRAYATCIQSALAAAGGDAAPASFKAVLSARSNAAVAEAEAVDKLYQERVGAAQTATRGTEPALRKLVEGLATGTPDYDLLTEQMQRLTRQQLGNLKRDIAALGAIQSIEFRGVGATGWDVFDVQGGNAFERAKAAPQGRRFAKFQWLVAGTNHDWFNTVWYQEDHDVRIPLARFPGVDLHRLAGVELRFGVRGRPTGSIELADLALQ